MNYHKALFSCLLFAGFIVTSLIFPKPQLNAQVPDNQFDCTWDDGTNKCVVKNYDASNSTHQCAAGNEPDFSICESFNNDASYTNITQRAIACESSINNQCISANPTAPKLGFKCAPLGSGCQPCSETDPSNICYNTQDSCNAACNTTPQTILCTGNGCLPQACNLSTNILCFESQSMCEWACYADAPCDIRDSQVVCEYSAACEWTSAGCRIMSTPTPEPFTLCKQAGVLKAACKKCKSELKIWTAFGCIEYTQTGLITDLSRVVVSVAGGFGVLLIILGAFTITTSAGNPEKLSAGKEIITSAIIGLLFILFSGVILQLIGISIINLPGI